MRVFVADDLVCRHAGHSRRPRRWRRWWNRGVRGNRFPSDEVGDVVACTARVCIRRRVLGQRGGGGDVLRTGGEPVRLRRNAPPVVAAPLPPPPLAPLGPAPGGG